MDVEIVKNCARLLKKKTNFIDLKTINNFTLSQLEDVYLITGSFTNNLEHYDKFIWEEKKVSAIQKDTIAKVELLKSMGENEKIIRSELNTSTDFYNLGEFVKIEKFYRQKKDSTYLYFTQILNDNNIDSNIDNNDKEKLIDNGWTFLKLDQEKDKVNVSFLFKYDIQIPECFKNIVGLKGLESILNISKV